MLFEGRDVPCFYTQIAEMSPVKHHPAQRKLTATSINSGSNHPPRPPRPWCNRSRRSGRLGPKRGRSFLLGTLRSPSSRRRRLVQSDSRKWCCTPGLPGWVNREQQTSCPLESNRPIGQSFFNKQPYNRWYPFGSCIMHPLKGHIRQNLAWCRVGQKGSRPWLVTECGPLNCDYFTSLKRCQAWHRQPTTLVSHMFTHGNCPCLKLEIYVVCFAEAQRKPTGKAP